MVVVDLFSVVSICLELLRLSIRSVYRLLGSLTNGLQPAEERPGRVVEQPVVMVPTTCSLLLCIMIMSCLFIVFARGWAFEVLNLLA